MARRRSHSRRRMHGLGATTRMGRAAKACKGKPGAQFRSCVASHMRGRR